MSLSNTLTPFLFTFYFLGKSPYPSATATTNSFKRFSFKLPVFVLVGVSLYVTIHIFTNDQSVPCLNRVIDIIHVLLIISALITNLVSAYQCIFHDRFWIQLQESFYKLQTEYQDVLPNKNLNFAKFRMAFVLKCSAMLISYIILVFARIMSRISNAYYRTSYMVALSFFNDLCALQVVFYVDLIQFFLKTITYAFQDINRVTDNGKCLSEAFIDTKFITSMKQLHSSICKSVDKVNEHFGLFLLSYVVQQFLVISYYIFWIFLNKFDVGLWTTMGL